MAEIRHLENWHDVIFFCREWSDLDNILETGAEWHLDCGDVVEIETRCRIPIWRTFGQIQWHVTPEPRITLQGVATWWIYCHDSRATCHIAGCSHLAKSMSWSCHIVGCKNSISHIENRFFVIFCLFFLFFNAVWALTSGGFRIVSDTQSCLISITRKYWFQYSLQVYKFCPANDFFKYIKSFQCLILLCINVSVYYLWAHGTSCSLFVLFYCTVHLCSVMLFE